MTLMISGHGVLDAALAAGEPLPVERLRYVLDGWYAQRSAIRQGICRIHWHRVRKTNSFEGVGGSSSELEAQDLLAFDLERLMFRYEKDEQERQKMSDGGAETHTSLKRTTVATPEFVTRIVEPSPLITVERPETQLEDWWEVRILGVAYYHEDILKGIDLDEKYNSLMAYFDNGDFRMYKTPDSGIHKIVFTWETPSGTGSETVFWIDTSKGFTPIKMTQRVRLLKPLPNQTGEWTDPIRSSIVEWDLVNEVFVPISARLEANTPKPGYEGWYSHETLDLKLDWESVNKPLEEDLFTVESLSSPSGRNRILDKRFGPPMLVQHPDIPDAKKLAAMQERNREPTTNALAEQSNPAWIHWVIIFVNAPIFVILLIYILRRAG